jgi:uracil-DNA glycosylase
MRAMLALLVEVRSCRLCAGELPHEPRPVVRPSSSARLLIAGQAPGRRVHETGIPWNDPSGVELRRWLELSSERFYDERRIALVPAGFCFPGSGSGGDLPPRPECAATWLARLLEQMPRVRLILAVGAYAHRLHLGERCGRTLTQTVAAFREHLPGVFPLPHPSPRNRRWLRDRPWFEREVLPELRRRVRAALDED